MRRNNSCRRRKRTEKKTIPLPYLPHELIIQILLRLPVKSLIRFKCVCKSWFSLISDNHFANSHFEITASTHTRRILLTNVFPDFEPISIDFEPSIHDDIASPDLHYLFPDSYFGLQIKGSCRGFILLHAHSNFYLLNPATEFQTEIPFSPFGSEEDGDEYEEDEKFYGFGYDHSTDDYLLVLISFNPIHFEFFSLRANTWKQIEYAHLPFNPIVGRTKPGLHFNDGIHWLAYHHDLRKGVIVVFDLVERKLFYMDLPYNSYWCCNLWVFGEFLSFSTMNFRNNTVMIWTMKEYKVNSSWTKTHVVSVDGTPNESFSPLCCTKNGDIIGIDQETGLVRYNDKGQLLEHRPYSSEFEAVVYTESLLSLPGESEQA